MKGFRLFSKGIVGAVVTGSAIVSSAFALPFNNDMVDTQIKAGQIMRPKVANAISIGSLDGDFPIRIEKKADTASFVNPKKSDAKTVLQGKRLFEVNCLPCHGSLETVPHQSGVAGSFMGAPDLTADTYKDRTDGSLYGTIHFGGLAIMPGYGWKLSPDEHWSIITYLRKKQSEAKK